MELHQIKMLLHNKRNGLYVERLPIEWENIFARYTSDKGLIARTYRELKKLNSPEFNDPIKK
jgi:hypothetical protein